MENTEVEILLVEDNMNDAELTIRSFRKNNVANGLIHLRDGADAIDFLFGTGKFTGRNINSKSKIILLDLKMPKVDGMEVLKKIKADEITKNIPVVMLTSSSENPDIEKCYQLGANSYIVKPVEFDGFVKAVFDLRMYWMLLNQTPF